MGMQPVANVVGDGIASIADVGLFDVVLWLHILAGVGALLAGLGAILTAKGRPRHNASGRVYVGSMAFVVVSAIPLSVRIDSRFLLAIAVFSGYLVASGYRVIMRRRQRYTDPQPVDYALHGLMLVTAAAMIIGGGYGRLTGTMPLGEVLVVFGLIGGLLAWRELDTLRSEQTARAGWVARHIAFMGGGYIATVTATVTVNLTMLPPVLRWLGPTLVGVPLIVLAIRRYQPRFEPARAEASG